ncbi:MAG: hypothetical protein K9L83_09350, partial [Deltaproteobacteria bacterium]|nr:hypothetical protein [Deltaproteobacteria bacterium]
EIHAPDVYQAVLEADKRSLARYSGHGSALAQAYNHMIMPLHWLQDELAPWETLFETLCKQLNLQWS